MDIRTSPLVEMAGEAKRPTRWWLAWIVAGLIIVVAGTVGTSVGTVVLGRPGEGDALYQFEEFPSFAFMLVALLAWVRWKEGRAFSSIGFRGSNPVGKLVLGLVIGAAMMTIGVLVTWALGEYSTGVSEHTNVGSSSVLAIAMLFVVFIVQASTEEAVTRGYMLQVAGRQINGVVAVLAGSVYFAVLHIGAGPLALFNIALYAVFASLVALGQGNLWVIAGIHAGWNYFQGNIYGLPVSGNAEANSLWAFGPSSDSHDLVSGGDFGLEASLVGTLVLAVASVVAFILYRRQEARRTATTPKNQLASESA